MSNYHRPDNLKDALTLLSEDAPLIAAGCTDLFAVTEKQELVGDILDLTAIPELKGINRSQEGWRIGASTTWSEIANARLPEAFGALQQAAVEVGGIQIQNAGTVGGNICNASPAADGVPPLLALNAQVEVASKQRRRRLPLGEFLTGARQKDLSPREIVTAVYIPSASARGRSAFLKLGARAHLVISMVMVAARIATNRGVIEDVSVAVGACSPVAQRLRELETALLGRTLQESDAVVADHFGDRLTPIDDIRANAVYRSEAARELVVRVLHMIGEADQ
ncbi:CO/xanthine dehydrogenase FAD-binding subunit [Shimia isoporae]|uniref:CO/xanthine dehydrogenase FAD-binding subunit n=1 Tax=Shimia isoporae TaxID=647720 RepID=A0A4R1NM57_9RHOB|nr:xanthine dehydrogenase family protein subunit M [Shimia isoporae]TCL09487.1 CO/xanthine dehydrogenase FAD-binding subunit [Shimia isoporae]